VSRICILDKGGFVCVERYWRRKTASLYKRMYDAGCVFQFVVLASESAIEVGWTTSASVDCTSWRADEEALHWHQKSHKGSKVWGFFQSRWLVGILEGAIATPLSKDGIRNLTLTDRADIFERLALYACFFESTLSCEILKKVRRRLNLSLKNGANSLA